MNLNNGSKPYSSSRIQKTCSSVIWTQIFSYIKTDKFKVESALAITLLLPSRCPYGLGACLFGISAMLWAAASSLRNLFLFCQCKVLNIAFKEGQCLMQWKMDCLKTALFNGSFRAHYFLIKFIGGHIIYISHISLWSYL